MISNMLYRDVLKYRSSVDISKRYNVVACLYSKSNKLLSVGHNSYKTHPVQHRYAIKSNLHNKVCLHAEIDALIKCKYDPYKIFVMRFKKDKSLGLARPCPICQLALLDRRVGHVHFTTYDEGVIEYMNIDNARRGL